MTVPSTRGRRATVPTRIRVGTVVVLLAIWEALGDTGIVGATTLPPLHEVLGRLLSLLGSSFFAKDLGVSVEEILLGLLGGGGLGLVVGVLIAAGSHTYRAFEPLCYYLGAVPKIVLLPIFLLALGSGIGSKAGIGAVSAFFPVIVATALGVRRVDASRVKAAKTLGTSRWQLITKVYARAMFTDVLTGLRLGLAVAITGALLAETSVAQAGLGFRAIELYTQLDIAGMYGLILLVFCAALAINALLDRAIHRWSHWEAAGPAAQAR